MKGPYRYLVRDGELELAAARGFGLLSAAERQGHINAGEWVEAGLLDYVTFEVYDANDNQVREFGVRHDPKRGAALNASTIVRERLS